MSRLEVNMFSLLSAKASVDRLKGTPLSYLKLRDEYRSVKRWKLRSNDLNFFSFRIFSCTDALRRADLKRSKPLRLWVGKFYKMRSHSCLIWRAACVLVTEVLGYWAPEGDASLSKTITLSLPLGGKQMRLRRRISSFCFCLSLKESFIQIFKFKLYSIAPCIII